MVMALLLGCGARTGADVCKRTVAVTCKKIFACSPQAAAAQGFTSEADCTTRFAALQQCDRFASTNCDFSSLDKCLSETEALPCTATAAPASCTGISQSSFVCATPSGGGVTCTSVSVSSGGNTCTFTQSNCTDGKSYEVDCANGTCSCKIDGVTTKSSPETTFDFCGSSTSSRAEARAQCGWSAG